MFQTIQLANEALSNIQQKYYQYFKSINQNILHYVNFEELDGWVTVDIVNNPPDFIESAIKNAFGMNMKKSPKEASQLFHSIIKASVSPKATGAVEKKDKKEVKAEA
jgi:hypothetical protein